MDQLAAAQIDLGITPKRFWSLTPRELVALYRALAVKEARQRYYHATAIGNKHRSGRALEMSDFLPPEPKTEPTPMDWRAMRDAAREHVWKSQQLHALAGKVVSEDQLKGLIQ